MDSAGTTISTQTTPRTSQKLSAAQHRRRRHSYTEDSMDTNSGFCGALHKIPPAVPVALLRRLGTKDSMGIGKVRVLLRVCGNLPESSSDSSNFFTVDPRMKQVTLYDPSTCSSENRRVTIPAPKMFAFDTVFMGQDSQAEVCSNALTDVLHSVINGTDGCVFCFGNSKLGKSYTMIGTPDSSNSLGIIPCAIYWLFRGINEHKQKTGTRFSVRVSAVEVAGSQHVKDLLAGLADESDESPGVYLRDDPLFGTQLQNQTELRVSNPEKAASYLDTALQARSSVTKNHHFLFTVHVYQYSVTSRGRVAGGRSRLHLLDLGSCEQGKSDGMPLSGLGNVLLSILNGHKHLPYREQKVSQLLKECLHSVTCHAAMVAHVSPNPHHYNDTLSTVQLASRVHRIRRHKFKFGASFVPDETNHVVCKENGHSTGSSDVDPSSSEQSADTVIYVGPLDDATDGEHPPVYIPSLNSSDYRSAMGKALSGSAAEQKPSPTRAPSVASHSKQSSNLRLMNGNANYNKKDSPTHLKTNLKASPKHLNIHRNSNLDASGQKYSPSKSSTKSFNSKSSFGDQDGAKSSALGSDEKWIDGPRISRCKIAEARVLLKDNTKKIEKWVDGPLKIDNKQPPCKQLNGASAYGFMDSHKKNMIKKWVENQTLQHIQGKNVKVVAPLPRPPATGAEEEIDKSECDLKSNCGKEGVTTTNAVRNSSTVDAEEDLKTIVKNFEENDKCVKDHCDSISNGLIPDHFGDSSIKYSGEDRCNVRSENQGDGCEDPSQCSQEKLESENTTGDASHVVVTSPLKCSLGENSTECSCEEYDFVDVIDGVEIIEVEEPLEPVPTQDAWLQVTEEDIALSMSESDTFILGGGIAADDNHPLRALSEDSFDMSSPFSDMLSVEEESPQHKFKPYFGSLLCSTSNYQRPYSVYELSGRDLPAKENCPAENKESAASDVFSSYNQLTKLHEVFKTKLARTNSCRIVEDNQDSFFKCHSFSLSDVFCNPNWTRSEDKNGYSSGYSIFSEPVPTVKKPPDLCYNCKTTLHDSEKTWYDEILRDSASVCNKNGYKFRSKLTGSWYNISSLRHPDGSSNPDLKEVDRISDQRPNLDFEEIEMIRERIRKRQIKSLPNVQDEDDDTPPPLPPPFVPSVPTRMHNSFFKRCMSRCRSTRIEQVDRCKSSVCQKSKSPTVHLCTRISGALKFLGNCESPDYENIRQDSDCCSPGSSLDYKVERPLRVSILQYCREDVERLERRWSQTREGKLRDLLQKQRHLKTELADAKARLLIPDSRWTYGLSVVETMDQKDPNFLDALETETRNLKRRVNACKSRILMVTCFDIHVTPNK